MREWKHMGEKLLFDHDLSGIINLNEELVIELMEIILNEDRTICRCPVCIEDIYALSLNLLTPLYVQDSFKARALGNSKLTRNLDRGHVDDVVRKAISTVSKNPYH